MGITYAKLQSIEHNDVVTDETNPEFLHHLQTGLLLALRERGVLTLMQYRHADEKLRQKRIRRAGNILKPQIQDHP